MRTANPTLNEKVFTGFGRTRSEQAMSIQGTVNKTAILLALALLTAGWTWNLFTATGNPAAVAPWLMGGAIGGLVVALVTTFKQTWAPFTAPVYALLEGLVLGGLSAIFEASYPGIAFQAVGLTAGDSRRSSSRVQVRSHSRDADVQERHHRGDRRDLPPLPRLDGARLFRSPDPGHLRRGPRGNPLQRGSS